MATLWDALDLQQQLNKTPLGGLAYYNICSNKICQNALARATWRGGGHHYYHEVHHSDGEILDEDTEENSEEHVPQSMSKEKVADLDAVKACNSPLIKGFSLIQWHIKKIQMTCSTLLMHIGSFWKQKYVE